VSARLWRGCAGPKRDQVVYGPIPDGRPIDKWLWLDPNSTDGVVGCTDDDVSDLVPLVTLTEDDAQSLLTMLLNAGHAGHSAVKRLGAQFAPPRMDEPTEFGAMVEAGLIDTGDTSDRMRFVRLVSAHKFHWRCEHGAEFMWSSLHDPLPIGGDS
jgi:hypothetical protein